MAQKNVGLLNNLQSIKNNFGIKNLYTVLSTTIQTLSLKKEKRKKERKEERGGKVMLSYVKPRILLIIN